MIFSKEKHKLGFWQVVPTPTKEDLEKYYKEKYYQECTADTYTPDYSAEEIKYFKNRAEISEIIWQNFCKENTGSFFDVGCGEGFTANYFLQKGWKVEACDFSSYGVEKHNPEILPNFIQGNIYKILDEKIKKGFNYDLINLSNVLEHVTDPIELIYSLKKIMNKKSLLRISVPNDYSAFQEFLMQNKSIDKETWFSPPDHLNYFTKESLYRLFESSGFSVIKSIADFPIEMYLVNEFSNYTKNPHAGSQAHSSRVLIDNFLVNQNINNYIDYMSASCSLGFGRSIIAYVSLK